MEINLELLISNLLTPASWAAFVGAILCVVLIVFRRAVNGRLKPVWDRFVDKAAAVIAAAGTGLLMVERDSLESIMTPILVAMLVVGLSVGLYRYLFDLIFPKAGDVLKPVEEPEDDDDPEIEVGPSDDDDED